MRRRRALHGWHRNNAFLESLRSMKEAVRLIAFAGELGVWKTCLDK
jgi:hypothetical protein